jgi:hypothetical protein
MLGVQRKRADQSDRLAWCEERETGLGPATACLEDRLSRRWTRESGGDSMSQVIQNNHLAREKKHTISAAHKLCDKLVSQRSCIYASQMNIVPQDGLDRVPKHFGSGGGPLPIREGSVPRWRQERFSGYQRLSHKVCCSMTIAVNHDIDSWYGGRA